MPISKIVEDSIQGIPETRNITASMQLFKLMFLVDAAISKEADEGIQNASIIFMWACLTAVGTTKAHQNW